MSQYRSYFSKNNTIQYGSNINTAKNPCTDIFYGDANSKYIFKIDLDDLKTKIDDGDYILNSGTTHTLHLTNTIFNSESLIGAERMTGRLRATSFDLILFPLTEEWDEGVGYDYSRSVNMPTNDMPVSEKTLDIRPSNWYDRTTVDEWAEPGIFSGTPSSIISTIHFDNGNEDIDVDITSYVNGIVSGGSTNYGLGLSFTPAYIGIRDIVEQSVSFFSKYTQTFFEPYLETVFDDTIVDNRYNFISDAQRNLYLYVSSGGNFVDLDDLPTVSILNSNNVSISGLTGLQSTKIRKGIYKITFGLTGQLCDGKRFYYDNWSNLSINGVTIADVKQKFIPKPYTDLYTIGINPTESKDYVVKYSGIKMNEKIKRNEKRKVVVEFKSFDNPYVDIIDDAYYRIYIKEGLTQINIFDWIKMDKTNENSFVLNTEYLIPREYNIEIKGKVFNNEIFYNNELKFEIVSEK